MKKIMILMVLITFLLVTIVSAGWFNQITGMPVGGYCGDGVCNWKENLFNVCPQDCEEVVVCSDSDGGLLLDIYGSTTGNYGVGGVGSYSDYCITTGPYDGQLVEYFCIGEWVQFHRFDCPNGMECNSGECVSGEEDISCESFLIDNDEYYGSISVIYMGEDYLLFRTNNEDGDMELYLYDFSTELKTFIANYNVYHQPGLVNNFVYYITNEDNFYSYDISTGVTTQIIDNGEDYNFNYLEDNYVIYYNSVDGDRELYLYDISTGVTTQITDNEEYDILFRIDGNNLFFHSGYGDDRELYLYDISTGVTTQITDNDGDYNLMYAAWHIDSDNYVIYYNSVDGDRELYLYDISTGVTTQITDNDVDDSFLHRINDNSFTYYNSVDGDRELYLYDISTGVTTQITDNDVDDWVKSYEESKVIIANDVGGYSNLYLYDISTGVTTQITDNEEYEDIDFAAIVFENGLYYTIGLNDDYPYQDYFNQLYFYDISTGVTTQIRDFTFHGANQGLESWPRLITGNKDLYADYENNYYVLKYFDIVLGTTAIVVSDEFSNVFESDLFDPYIFYTTEQGLYYIDLSTC